jgi:N-acetylated-alpha-linked acidic dipeptidase
MMLARTLCPRSPTRFGSILALGVLLAAGSPGSQAPAPETAASPPSRELLLGLTESPRLAGTCGSLVGAKYVARVLEQAGWKVEFDEREVLLSLPRNIEFSIYEDAFAEKPLSQRIERFDPDAIPPGDVPMCNGWSASGTVRGRVVDAGRGLRADFERLKSIGVDVRGAVALMRYGGCYRGIKVDLATEYGCAAALLFSDPDDDGPGRGETWPEGPWKPDWDAQRGSINPIARIPGDPSTPGWASPKPGAKDARRASAEELAAWLPTIPCVPIGWRDAKVLIANLAKVQAKDGPKDEDGKPKTQALGPGPVQVRLLVDQPRDYRVIRNVIARLPGASEQTVIAGAHRDAWVRGANDDGAGTVAMLRAAQHLGEKAKTGWKPQRTITLGFWDAEEFGLIGSTDWGEANAEWLRKNAIAYVNADTGVNGPRFRGAGGSPGMLSVLRSVLERTPAAHRDEGETPANLWEEWREALAARAKASGKEEVEAGEPRLGLPGSGSDFAVFVHHLNIPCLEPGFGGGGGGGAYHTTFDDFLFVEKYVDPGFVGHELAGRFYAELLAEIADRGDAAFSPAEAAAEWSRRAREATGEFGESMKRLADAFSERVLTRDQLLGLVPEGLPNRSWFRNRLWAPGLEDGYGSEVFPTLRGAAQSGPAALDLAIDAWIGSMPAPEPAPTGN